MSPLLYNDDDQLTGDVVDGSSGQITGFGTTGDGVLSPFLALEIKKNSVSFAVENAIELNEGSSFSRVTLTVSLKRRDQLKRQVLEAMGAGQRMLAFAVTDGNGNTWLFRNMQLATNAEANGATKAEGSKYDITFVGEMDAAPRTLSVAAKGYLVA